MNRTRSIMDCFWSAVVLNCIAFGLFGCLFSVIELDEGSLALQNMNIGAVLLQSMSAVLIPFAVICSFLYYSRESIRIGVSVMVVFLSLLVGIFREQLLVCFRVIASGIVCLLNRYYGLSWNINSRVQDVYSLEFREGILILALCMIFLLSVDVAGTLKAKRIFAVFLILMFFSLCVGKLPSFFFTLLLVAGLFALFSAGLKTRDFTKKWKSGGGSAVKISCEERQEARETPLHSSQKAAVFTVLCFFVALFLGFGFTGKFGEELLEFHTPIQEWANELEYNLMHYDYSRIFRDFGNTPEETGAQGRLNNNRIHYTGKEVLQVTVDKKPAEAMYLRGFIGKDYQGEKWSEVSEDDFFNEAAKWGMEREALTIGQEVENFTFNMLKSQYLSESGIRIAYIDAPGKYAYLPYFTKVDDSLRVRADGVIERESGENNMLSGVLNTQGYWELTGRYYKMVTEAEGEMLAGIMAWNLALEDQYSDYVKEQYLEVPEDSLAELKKVCGEHPSYKGTVLSSFIKNYLWKNAEYSMELDPLPYGEDFTEYFLYSQKKGYCIHFATAAVLMYRMYEVPARFVEGYVIWPEEFKKNKDGTYTASVLDSNAHAWAEIYHEDFGFMPVDMTPPDAENEATAAEGEDPREDETGEMPEIASEEEQTVDEKEEEVPLEEQKDGTEAGIAQEKEKDASDKKKKKKKDSERVNEEKGGESQNGSGDENDSETGSAETSDDIESEDGGTDLEKETENLKLGLRLAAFMGIYLVLAAVVLTVWNIFYRNRRYRKNRKELLQGIKDEKRQEVIEISCRFHAYMEILGKERAWKKKYGDNISDREYETIMKKELFFLKHGEHRRFLKTVQKALYCSPEAENVVSDIDLEECRKFLRLVKEYLTAHASWHQRILMGGIYAKR